MGSVLDLDPNQTLLVVKLAISNEIHNISNFISNAKF